MVFLVENDQVSESVARHLIDRARLLAQLGRPRQTSADTTATVLPNIKPPYGDAAIIDYHSQKEATGESIILDNGIGAAHIRIDSNGRAKASHSKPLTDDVEDNRREVTVGPTAARRTAALIGSMERQARGRRT